ncbi:type II toxin-antitoxin system ChpB family toxin [Methylobacillus arboreus]|uniref:type II toxin-antitoxin system ChpB family toxin n=1 Tax=Methylobacillus arboreus TaxID=755170 RepID=UPI001E35BE67|nr:type II toxin-antitoxin system ChpB family toxin [Methylobacillus arboreus]MCB5191211.1 type II toxin-antitoxin system ChpB family toxin [Methylobacillus arboreus]
MVFNKGDIVRTSFNPVAGKELQGEARPALVITPKAFNQVGLSWIVPISQGGVHARVEGFAVSLAGTGLETQGVVLCNGIRNLDLNARSATFVEKAPGYIVEEVMDIITAILDAETPAT